MTYKITVICYQGHESQYEDINTVNLNQSNNYDRKEWGEL